MRLQLGQALFTPVANPFAGQVPGGLGAATVTRERLLMAFPYYDAVSVRNPRLGNYLSHQLQVSVRKRMQNGLLLDFAYTGGKKISDSTLIPVDFGPIEQVTQNEFQDGLYNRRANRSLDPGDVAQRLVTSALYELPFGRGKPRNPANAALSRIVSGWQLNLIGVMQAGIPLTVRGANNFQADRPSSTGKSAKLPRDQRSAQRWFDTAQFVNPPAFTFGNVSRTLPDVRHPGAINFDASVIKATKFGRFEHELRVEVFNVLNHPQFERPGVGTSGNQLGNAAFGQIGQMLTNPACSTCGTTERQIQLSMKLKF